MASNLIPCRKRKEEPSLARPEEWESPFLTMHRRWDDLFEHLFRGFEEAFGLPEAARRERRAGTTVPSVDIAETDDELQVSVDLPGLEEKDLEVTVEDDTLTVRGEKKQEREEKKRDYHLVERSYGEFSRSIPLPRGIDRDRVKATFKNGVLKVSLAKTPEAKSNRRVIPVASE